jgi:hypothetical protein
LYVGESICIEHRAVIKYFLKKGMTPTEITIDMATTKMWTAFLQTWS